MLGAVVLSFFLCLLPFRALTLLIIAAPRGTLFSLGIDGWYSLLFFCRVMHYLNSALNPILYNLMSSKFREGFLRLLGCKSMSRKTVLIGTRKGTFHTTSTNLSSTNSDKQRFKRRNSSLCKTIASSSHDDSCSSASDQNGQCIAYQRQLSFEDASNNIIRCAKAIFLQNNVIPEADEMAADHSNSYQTQNLPDNQANGGLDEVNVQNRDVDSLYSTGSDVNQNGNNCVSTNGDHKSILTPLLQQLQTINGENYEHKEINQTEAIISRKFVDDCKDVEYQFSLENILSAKESLV